MSNTTEQCALPDAIVALTRDAISKSLSLQIDERHVLRSIADDQLERFIHVTYQASLFRDEDRLIRFQAIFDDHATIKLMPAVEFTPRALAKLAPTVNLGKRKIVVWPDADTLRIIGFLDHEFRNDRRRSLVCETINDRLLLAVYGPGFVRVGYPAYVELKRGEVHRLSMLRDVPSLEQWFKEVGRTISRSATLLDADTNWGAALATEALGKILQKIVDAGHGGCLLIAGKPAVQTLKVKYTAPYAGLWQVLVKLLEFEHALSESDPARRKSPHEAFFVDRDAEHAFDFVASLAAVDGAVVMNLDLTVVGFGAEIPVPSDSCREVEEYGARIDDDRPTLRNVEDFGMRHRSAISFCNSHRDAIALVVSQDGDISAISNANGTVRKELIATTALW